MLLDPISRVDCSELAREMAVFVRILGFLALAMLTDKIQAMFCTIGQEPDPASDNRYRWVIPVEHPCLCTEVQVGGANNYTPKRPFKVKYYDSFLYTNNSRELRVWLRCQGVFECSKEERLGMEDGRILDGSITASSYYRNDSQFEPARARLNTQGFAAAWVPLDSDIRPWIQVEFTTTVTITGLITQGRGEDAPYQRVTKYQVAQSDDGQSWDHVTYTDGPAITFPGNIEEGSTVTTRFPTALHARFIRILPTEWISNHCSMRFEVIGCYQTE